MVIQSWYILWNIYRILNLYVKSLQNVFLFLTKIIHHFTKTASNKKIIYLNEGNEKLALFYFWTNTIQTKLILFISFTFHITLCRDINVYWISLIGQCLICICFKELIVIQPDRHLIYFSNHITLHFCNPFQFQ